MLALAIEAEVEEFINQHHTLKDEGGRRLMDHTQNLTVTQVAVS